MSLTESKHSPWDVTSLDDFLFYCCPECDSKHVTKPKFILHAFKQHPEAKDYLGNLEGCTVEDGVEVEEIKIEDDSDISEIKFVNPEGEEIKDEEPQVTEDALPSNIARLIKMGCISLKPPTTPCKPVTNVAPVTSVTPRAPIIPSIRKKSPPPPIIEESDHDNDQDYDPPMDDDNYDNNDSDDIAATSDTRKRKKVNYNENDEEDDDEDWSPIKDAAKRVAKVPKLEGPKKKNPLGRTRYMCNICNEPISTLKEELIKHKKQVHGIKELYPCKLCDKKLPSKYAHDEHVSKGCDYIPEDNYDETEEGKKKKNPLGRTRYMCNICNEPISTLKDDLIRHKKQVHGLKDLYPCKHCEMKFPSKWKLEEHQREHYDGPKPDEIIPKVDMRVARSRYMCNICNIPVSTSKKDLIRHKRQFHGDIATDLYPCKKCDLKFSSEYQLTDHVAKEHKGTSFTCELCGAVFAVRNIFNKHMRRQHHQYEIPQEKIVKKCDQCDTVFKVAIDLNSHLQFEHKCDKDFKCKLCDTTWVSHLSLELHYMDTHGRVQYCCHICGYATFQPSPLRKHIAHVHENQKNYFCDLCGKAFQQAQDFTAHLAKKHGIGETKYKCDLCDKIFRDNTSLKTHVQDYHIRDKEYKCAECKYSTFSQKCFNRHVTNMHTEGGRKYPCNFCHKAFATKRESERHMGRLHKDVYVPPLK